MKYMHVIIIKQLYATYFSLQYNSFIDWIDDRELSM